MTKQQADEALKKIRRDLVGQDPNDIIVSLVTEIMQLKQIAEVRREINEDLQEENADLRRKLLFGEE